MNICLKIKQLRINHQMTQADLGELVGLSAKAISRWENESSYPDISLLPILANIFEVTTDELLDVNSLKQQEEVQKIIEQDKVLWNEGKTKEREKLIRDSIKKYPNNYQLKSLLLSIIYVQTAEDTSEAKAY